MEIMDSETHKNLIYEEKWRKIIYEEKERAFLNGRANIHGLFSAASRVEAKTRVRDNFRAFNFDPRQWKILAGFSRRSELLRASAKRAVNVAAAGLVTFSSKKN